MIFLYQSVYWNKNRWTKAVMTRLLCHSLRIPWTQFASFLLLSIEISYSAVFSSCSTHCGFFHRCHVTTALQFSIFECYILCECAWEERACLLKKKVIERNLSPCSSHKQYLFCPFCYRSKTGDSYGVQDNHTGSSGGGGIGKWLREHLGGGSKGSHDINSTFSSKGNANIDDNGRDNKSLGKTIYTSQNLYCSLPREHGRYMHNSARKIINHGNSAKSHGYDRPRSNSMNHHEKFMSSDLGTLTRGGPIYGSEGRSLKKRNRDRRRHSLHETHDQGRNRRRR